MPPAVNQEINVNINALVKGLQTVRELAGLIRNLRERTTGKVQIDEKIAQGAQASTTEVDRLVAAVDTLGTKIDQIDERRFSRLAAAASVIGTIYTAITNVPAFVEGVDTLKDLGNKAPAIAGGISSIATGARNLIQVTRQKVGDGLTKAKEVVTDLVSKLPGIPISGTAAAGTLRTIGIAGAGAAVGVGALAAVLGVLLAAVLAVTASVAIFSFLFSLAKGAADADSSIHDLSQELAVSAETLSALQVATATTSTSFEEAAGGVSKFNKLIGEARDGSDEARRNLIRLGVDPQQGFKDNEAALAAVFKRIHELPTPYEKARAAQIAFGKSGANMVAVIDSVGGSLDKAKDKAKEFGRLLDTEAARAADEFGDQVDELKLRVEGFGLSIGRALIPQLLKLLRVFSHEMPGAGGIFQTVLNQITLNVEILVNTVLVAIASIKTLAALPAALATLLGTGNFESAFRILRDKFKQELTELILIANTPAASGGSTGPDFPFGKPEKGEKKTPADVKESEFDFRRANAEIGFNLEIDLIDRLTKSYEAALAKRKISTDDFYKEIEKLRRRALEAELKFQQELSNLEHDKFANEQKKIDDGETTGPQKKALKEIAENKFFTALAPISERIQIIRRDLEALPGEIEALQEAADLELVETFNQLNDEIDAFNGKASKIEIGEILKRLNPIVEDLKKKFGETSTEVQLLQAYIDALVSNAQLKSLLIQFDRVEASRQARIGVATANAGNNELAQFQLREELNRINSEYLQVLLAQIAALEERAKVEGATPEIQNEIARRRAAVDELQRSLNDTQLKDTAINSLVSGGQQFVQTLLQGVTSLKDLKNAALSFAQSFLSALSDIIVKMLLMKALSAIFGGVTGGGGVTPGGALTQAPSAFPPGFATGGDVGAAPGGRHIIVAEGGYDEMVVSTDPRYAARTSNLLATFIQRTGIMPRFSAGSFALSVANSISQVPRLAAGAIVPAPSAAQLAAVTAGPTSFEVHNVNAIDPAIVLDALQGSSGVRKVLNIISNNPQAFRAALGI